MKTTIKTIDISAKQWLDKINGNSYFSAIITINYGMEGESTIKVPFEYGYGDYYRFAAYKAITEQYPELKDVPMSHLTKYGIITRSNIQKNCLKREVKEWGQN